MSKRRAIRLGRTGFWAIALTVFTVAYNVAVMPPLMPLIVTEFNSSIGYIQTILVLFSLVTASFAPTTENLCRYYSRTRIFVIGLALYGLGITLTALSPTMGALAVSFSIVAGMAATPLVNTPWALADLAFRGKAEEQAMAVLIVASALGALSGALLGGFLGSQFGWRWAFVPSLVLLVVVWLLRRSLPSLTPRYEEPLDWIGGLLSFLGLSCILMGISLSGEFGWWEPKRLLFVFGMLLPPFQLSIVPTLISVGVILLGFFIYWQRQQAHLCRASLLRVGLLRKPGFVLGMTTAMLHVLVTTGLQFNLYQFIPVVLSLNPFRTALTVIPFNVTMIVVVITVLRFLALGDRLPPKYIIYTGITLVITGIGILYRSLNPQLTSLELMPGLIIMGMGSGLFLSYISKLTYAATTVDEKPEGSGIYNPVQNLGNSLGRAILGTILIVSASRDIVDSIAQYLGVNLPLTERALIIAELQRMIQTLPRQEVRAILVSKLPPYSASSIRPISVDAAISGMQTSLLVALVLMAVCFILATTLPKYPSSSASTKPPSR